MPKKKATFQPTVRPDWAGAMEYIPETEQAQIFQAILMFPAIDLSNSAYWNKTIKPDLQQQYETFISSCEKKSIGIRKRWEDIKGIDMNTDVIDMIYIVKDKDKDKDKDNNSRNNIYNISTTHEGFVPPTLEEVLLYAKEQNSIAGMGGFKCSKNQAMNFYDFYAGQGWITSGNIPIRNWQMKLRGWCRQDTTKEEKIEKPIQA